MRELTLREETPQITINGKKIHMRLSDVELYLRAQALFAKWAERTQMPLTAEEIGESARETFGLLDQALGAEAARQVSGGKPVSLALAMEWLGLLAEECAAHYTELALEEE